MSQLQFSVKLVDNNSTISREIIKALLPDIQKYFNGIAAKISKSIPDLVINSIMNQPEYASLMSGALQYEFGLPDPANRLSEILSTIRANTQIINKSPQLKGNKISAGIKFSMIKSDFSDLLSLGGASLTTEKGSKLDWLDWLLKQGDSIIISDYNFIFGPSKYSRTGMGIMKEVTGGSWRVPPEFAGTINNNWITRAIDAASSDIDNLINKVFQ
jgi:hypothetical protein